MRRGASPAATGSPRRWAAGQVHEVPDATHYLFLDRRDEVLDQMKEPYSLW